MRIKSTFRFATGVVLVIALVAAAFGAEGYMKAGRSEKRVAALQTELASLQSRVAGDERAAAGERARVRHAVARANAAQQAVKRVNWQLQSVPSEAQLAGMRSQLTAYAACVPELQSEVAGLRLNWRIDFAKPATDNFKLFSTAPMAPSCSSLLGGR